MAAVSAAHAATGYGGKIKELRGWMDVEGQNLTKPAPLEMPIGGPNVGQAMAPHIP